MKSFNIICHIKYHYDFILNIIDISNCADYVPPYTTFDIRDNLIASLEKSLKDLFKGTLQKILAKNITSYFFYSGC